MLIHLIWYNACANIRSQIFSMVYKDTESSKLNKASVICNLSWQYQDVLTIHRLAHWKDGNQWLRNEKNYSTKWCSLEFSPREARAAWRSSWFQVYDNLKIYNMIWKYFIIQKKEETIKKNERKEKKSCWSYRKQPKYWGSY